ncbi:MAG: hypothetical protein JXQ75_09830 [Phycisphaerae bacterium]|nr:hypothetical protein [Phycisphaerae bacterium]
MDETTTDMENFFQLTLIDLFFRALEIFLNLILGVATNVLSGFFGWILP